MDFAKGRAQQMRHKERRFQASQIVRVLSDALSLHAGVLIALALTSTTAEQWAATLTLFPTSLAFTVVILLAIDPMRLGSNSTNRVASSLFIEAASLVFLLMIFSRSAFGPVAALSGAVLGVLIAILIRFVYRVVFPRKPSKVVAVMSGRPQAADDEQQILLQLQQAPPTQLVLVRSVIDAGKLDLGAVRADTMVLSPWLDPDRRVNLSLDANRHGIKVRAVPSIYEIILATAPTTGLWDLFVLDLAFLRRAPTGFRAAKRLVDLVIASVGLVVVAPILAVLAVAIRMTSPGPAVYSQERVGRDGEVFLIKKLRTMSADAEADSGAVLALADDDRVTRIGGFLRSSRLDEIPQLYNILRGEMSLVGPRPERPEFVDQYVDTVPGYDQRHLVRPGLTGLAQVRGTYASNPAAKLRYDLYYVRRPSMLFDIQIMAETLGAVLKRGSAAGTAHEVSAEVISLRQFEAEGDGTNLVDLDYVPAAEAAGSR